MDRIEVEPGLFLTSDYCVWYKPRDIIILADIHMGYESGLKDEGFSLPLFQKDEVLDKLSTIKDKYDPNTFVVAGDFKHDFGRSEQREFSDILDTMDYILQDCDLTIIRGNHDNYLQNLTGYKGIPFYEESIKIDDIFITHGHLELDHDGILIMGHEHPSLKIRDEIGAIIKRPCFLHSKKHSIIILPAFSPMAEGRDIVNSKKFFSEILSDIEDLKDFDIYALSEDGIIHFQTIEKVRKAYYS